MIPAESKEIVAAYKAVDRAIDDMKRAAEFPRPLSLTERLRRIAGPSEFFDPSPRKSGDTNAKP